MGTNQYEKGKAVRLLFHGFVHYKTLKKIYFFDSKFENILKIILIQPLFFVLYNKILLELYMDVQYNMEVQLNWFNWFANWFELINKTIGLLLSVQCSVSEGDVGVSCWWCQSVEVSFLVFCSFKVFFLIWFYNEKNKYSSSGCQFVL